MFPSQISREWLGLSSELTKAQLDELYLILPIINLKVFTRQEPEHCSHLNPCPLPKKARLDPYLRQ